MKQKREMKPELRFSDFNQTWEIHLIGDFYKELRTGMTPYRGNKAFYKNGTIPWITSGELNYNNITETNEYITENAVKHTNLVIYPKGTLFIAITGLEAPGTRGKCAINNVPATTNQSCMSFLETKNVDTKFLYYWYNKYSERLYFKYAQGTKQQSFNNTIVEKFPIILPSKEEQQKIATFLSSVDKRIEQLQQKKGLLEQYKKGVMQQLFSQKLRFKDENGNNYPDWEEKRLGDLLDYEQPTKYIVDSTEYDDTFEMPVLTAGKTFILGYTDEYENAFVNTPVIIFDDFTMANKFVDFAFKVKSSAMKILKPINNSVNIKFVYESMQMIDYPKGDEHKRFWISEYSKIKIKYPCDEEQIKIANFLSAIDTKITLVNTQIENTQQFKKGLLQQMFV